MSGLLEDLLDEDLTVDNVRVVVERIFDKEVGADRARTEKDRTPKNTKSLVGVYDLIRQAITDFERRARTPDANKVIFTEEEPDSSAVTEVITFSLIKQAPGAFGQGSPFESRIHNQRPILREEKDDTENPGYRVATLGYFYDNIIRLTCWAQTNKTANARAEWLSKLLEEYAWFFKAEGVDRFLFHERNTDIIEVIDNQRWYGRPLDYFVRTETIRTVSEKTIEEILITLVDPSPEY